MEFLIDPDEASTFNPDAITSATCTHCKAHVTFPGFSSIDAFVCPECGESSVVSYPVQ